MENEVFQDILDTVQKGLSHMTQDQADKIIGDYGQDGLLIKAMVAHNKLLYGSLIKECGVKDSPELMRVISNQQAVMLTLGHNLYASGVRRGRRRERRKK